LRRVIEMTKTKTLEETANDRLEWAKKNYPRLKKEYGERMARRLLLHDSFKKKAVAEMEIRKIEQFIKDYEESD